VEINKFDLKFDDEQIDKMMSYTKDILTSNRPISNGLLVQSFESRYKSMFNHEYALAVNSGTSALEVALRTINVKGKPVFFPVNTMIGTYLAIERVGCVPIPIDIDPETLSMSLDDLYDTVTENKIELEGSVMLMVHLGGSIGQDTPALIDFARKNGMYIVEDAAQAHGARLGNYIAGNIGDVGCFSFSATKPMTTAEGGMCTFKRYDDYEIAKAIRNFGSSRDLHSSSSRVNRIG